MTIYHLALIDMFDQDLTADLPAPRDDEPPQLRGDIADELADHLHCAYRREVLTSGDDGEARERVLNRFGDPKELARQLWWQAMWSRIMGQRVLAGVQWIVSLTAVLLAVAVFWQQSHILQELRTARQEAADQRQALTATLNQMRKQTEPPLRGSAQSPIEDTEPDSTSPTVTPLHPRIDGFPVTIKLVQEYADSPINATSATVRVHNAHGQYDFERFPTMIHHPGRIETSYVFQIPVCDRYELRINLPDGRYCNRPLIISENKPQEFTIACPSPRKRVPLKVMIPPLPKSLQSRKLEVQCEFSVVPLEIAGTKWHSDLTLPTVTFDSRTGLPKRIASGNQSMVSDDSDSPLNDSTLFFPVGPVGYQLSSATEPGAMVSSVICWPPQKNGEMTNLKHEIKPADKLWEIEIPDEFISELTRDTNGKSTSSAELVAGQQRGGPDGDSLAAAPAVLTVKCVLGTADGPAATVKNVWVGERHPDGVGHSGVFVFSSLQPDRYDVTVTTSDGQRLTQSVLIRDEQPREITVVCPSPRKKVPVLITMPPLPGDLQKAKFVIRCRFWPGAPEIAGKRWSPEVVGAQELKFDPLSGQTIEILNCENSQLFDLKDSAVEDRTVFLMAGPIHYRFELIPHSEPGPRPLYYWPAEENGLLIRSIAPDDDHWKLEFPKEYVSKLRRAIGSDVRESPTEAEPQPAGDALNAESLGEKCRLIVKFTSETKEGGFPEGVNAELWNEQGGRIAIKQYRPSELLIAGVSPVAGVDGRCYAFERIEPGRYQLKVAFPDGRRMTEQLSLLRPGQERTEHVVCPPPVKKSTIAIHFQPPENFRTNVIRHTLKSTPFQLDGRTWNIFPGYRNDIEFEATTGLLLQSGSIDLAKEQPEDRVLIIPTGGYTVESKLIYKGVSIDLNSHDVSAGPTHFAKPGENKWSIEIADERWAEIRKKIDEADKIRPAASATSPR